MDFTKKKVLIVGTKKSGMAALSLLKLHGADTVLYDGNEEAKEADIGIAGGKDEAVLFRHGEIVKKIPAQDAVRVLIEEINKL